MKKTLLLLSGMIIVNSVFAQSDTKLSLRITQEARDFIADYYEKAEKEVPLPAHPEETLIKMIQGSSIWHPESFVFGDFLPAFFTKIRIEAENKNLLSVTDYTKSDW